MFGCLNDSTWSPCASLRYDLLCCSLYNYNSLCYNSFQIDDHNEWFSSDEEDSNLFHFTDNYYTPATHHLTKQPIISNIADSINTPDQLIDLATSNDSNYQSDGWESSDDKSQDIPSKLLSTDGSVGKAPV